MPSIYHPRSESEKARKRIADEKYRRKLGCRPRKPYGPRPVHPLIVRWLRVV